MKHPLDDKKLGRDYLWYPIYNLLETKENISILNIGGGNAREWTDLAEKYKIKVNVVDKYYEKEKKFGGRPENKKKLSVEIKNKQLGDKIVIHKSDIFKYNGKLNGYDLLYARNSLHHIINHSPLSDAHFIKLYKKLYSLIKKGGIFYIRETGRINYFQYIKPKSKRKLHFPSKTNLEEHLFYLKKAGFSTVAYKYYVPNKVRFLLPILDNKIANRFLTSSFMIYAEKSQ